MEIIKQNYLSKLNTNQKEALENVVISGVGQINTIQKYSNAKSPTTYNKSSDKKSC